MVKIKKYLEFLNEQEEIVKPLHNDDITINDNVIKIPITYKDSIVNGRFSCDYSKIITLENSPKIVGKTFSCLNCDDLVSLKGGPKYCLGEFDCRWCKSLTSLEGAPESVSDGFHINGCISLKSLKGISSIIGRDFHCAGCKSLTSLEYAPKKPRSYNLCPCTDAYNSLGSLYTDETQKLAWTHAYALAYQGIFNDDFHRLLEEGISQNNPEELKEKILSLKHRYRGKDPEVLKLLGYNEMFYDDIISKRNTEEEVW